MTERTSNFFAGDGTTGFASLGVCQRASQLDRLGARRQRGETRTTRLGENEVGAKRIVISCTLPMGGTETEVMPLCVKDSERESEEFVERLIASSGCPVVSKNFHYEPKYLASWWVRCPDGSTMGYHAFENKGEGQSEN